MTDTPRPTIGRIVHYRLTEHDALLINQRREAGHGSGNHAEAGQVFPAQIVRVFDGPYANMQVSLDGNDILWATSAAPGDELGNWFWPPRA